MSKLFLKLSQSVLSVIITSALLLPVLAQKQSESAPKKSSGASTTCDGALDIVPTKAASFVRKRRPTKDTAKDDAKSRTAPADSKTSSKPPSR